MSFQCPIWIVHNLQATKLHIKICLCKKVFAIFTHIHLICALLNLQDFAMLVLHCFISGNKYARHKTWRT